VQTLPQAVAVFMFWFIDFAVGSPAVSQSHLSTVNLVSKSRFERLLAGFSKSNMTMKILSSSLVVYQKGFHIYNWLTEARYKLSLSGFGKDLHN
jgi:hypothetical protein